MRTEVIEPVAHRLSATGEDLATTWTGNLPMILDGEASIGDDLMAGAFGSVYYGDSAQIKAVAAQMPGDISGDGALAVECAGLYTTADDRGRAALAGRILDGA